MSLLALDLGTSTGFAIRSGDGQITSGTERFKPDRYSGGGMRYLRFKRWLTELHACSPFEEVYYEEVRRHLGVDASHVYGGFLATLTAWCESRQLPYAGVPVGTIKASATGRGNCDKQAMIDAMKAKGHAPGDDNEADALALLYFAISQQ